MRAILPYGKLWWITFNQDQVKMIIIALWPEYRFWAENMQTSKLIYLPFRILTYLSSSCWQYTSHHKVDILLFYGGDLVRLITFDETTLYQAVSCFNGKYIPLSFPSVMYLYFKNVMGKFKWKNERKWCSCETIIFDTGKCVSISLIIVILFI